MNIASIREVDLLAGDTFTIKYNADEVGDTAVSDTYIEVTGLPEEAHISAVGYVLNASSGIAFKFVDISGVGVVEDIEKDGVYMIMSSSLERLELTTTADCHLIIKQVL